MAISRGIAAFKSTKAQIKAEQEARERPRAEYFNWKNNKSKDDKDVVFVRFLQEFDEGVEGYDPNYGLPLSAVEHQAPGKEGFKRRASCTADEGACFACERHADDRLNAPVVDGKKKLKGWGQKRNFYIWALVDYKDGEGVKPVVISRSFNSSFVDDLIQEVEDDDNNQITNKMWRITRSGTGTSTAWKLKEAKGIDLYDAIDVEVIDLEEAVLRKISYEEQPGYYGAVYQDGDALDDDTVVATVETGNQITGAKTESGELQW